MQRLDNPTPLFLDIQGDPLDLGKIYVGVANADPEVSPITVYWDPALTIVAEQPLRTLGGTIRNGPIPAFAYVADGDYSMRVTEETGAVITYTPSAEAATVSYQPLDSDLTAIAALGTTAFGRSLLTLANAAALAAATGVPASLALTGGTVSGNIFRQSSGVHTYWVDPGMGSGRIFATAVGAADPTSLPGDQWLQVS